MKQEIPDIFKNVSPVASVETDYLQQQAENVIRSLAQTYLENARVQIQAISRYIQEARLLNNERKTQEMRDNLFQTAHDMKGQGTTFGYPLLTQIGAIICDRIRKLTYIPQSSLDEFEELTADMNVIIQFPPHTQNNRLKQIEKRVHQIREKMK